MLAREMDCAWQRRQASSTCAGDRSLRESTDGFFPAACVKVVSTWAVAALAARIFWLLLAGYKTLIMWIAIEGRRDFGMAGGAFFAPDIVVRQSRRGRG